MVTAAVEPPGSFNLLNFWQSQDNKKINYRQGYWVTTPVERGFGHSKIVNKHRLSNLSAHQMTKHPHRGIARDPQIPTRYHYLATAYDHECDGFLWWKECHVADTQDTRTIVEFNTEPSKYQGTLGVLTAFCEGETRCPWWMDDIWGKGLLPIP